MEEYATEKSRLKQTSGERSTMEKFLCINVHQDTVVLMPAVLLMIRVLLTGTINFGFTWCSWPIGL